MFGSPYWLQADDKITKLCYIIMVRISIHRVLTVPAVIIAIFLICSCGDMELVLPASRNYQVSARGETFNLDEYALIKKNENIRPFFIYPLKDDPDVTSILIYFNTADGIQAGPGIRYILKTAYDSENHEADQEKIILLNNLNGTLPVFPMPGDLETGIYTMVFQVFGKKQVLISRTEKSIYYIGDQDYKISDIRVYLPAYALPSHLIPPDTVVMLEAGINSDEDLDPYIIWYNGKTRIGEGRVFDGHGRILWKVPSQIGFHNIRAEVIPFPPLIPDDSLGAVFSGQNRLHRGKAMELSLPVSSRGELQGALSAIPGLPEQGLILCDYRLAGDLVSFNPGDSMIPADSIELEDPNYPDDIGLPKTPFTLIRVSANGRPRWYPAAGVYGLLVGSRDIYQMQFELPETSGNGPEEKCISFLLRFISLNEGIHFSFSLGSESCKISLSREEDSFLMIFNINETEEKIPLEINAVNNFCNLILDFTCSDDNLVFSVKDGSNKPLLEKNINPVIFPDRTGVLQFADNSNRGSVMVLGEVTVISSDTAFNNNSAEAAAINFPEAN